MSKFSQLILSIVVLISANYAFAAKSPFFIEPYTGYFIGERNGSNQVGGLSDGDLKSLYFGMRIGIELNNGLILGVDYGQGQGDFERSDDAEADYEQKDLGAYIGYRLNRYFRVYGSYIFKYEAEFDYDDIAQEYTIEGDGINAGISLKVANNISIGLEYQIRNLKEFANGNDISGSNKTDAYLLSLKLPFPLPFAIK